MKDAIAEGDVYQVNLVQHLSATFTGDPWGLAYALAPLRPLHGRVFAGDGWAIVSASPELFLARRKEEAVAAVPDDFCDEMSLVGPVARIRERYRAWADSGITGLTIVADQPEAMELMASLAR